MKRPQVFWVQIVIVLLVLLLSVYVARYIYAQSLCRKIAQGREIHTLVGDITTAPIWCDSIFSILQWNGVKIPLVEACYYRNIQAVETLLNNGADPNFFVGGRMSAVEAALTNSHAGPIDERSLSILEMLIEAGADVTLHASATSPVDQMASLMLPDCDIRESILLLLLDNGAVENPSESQNILHNVIRSGNVDLTHKLILDYGFGVNSIGHLGQTPLILAVYYGQYNAGESATQNMITMLLACGANKNAVDDFGKSALDYAVELGYKELYDILANFQ